MSELWRTTVRHALRADVWVLYKVVRRVRSWHAPRDVEDPQGPGCVTCRAPWPCEDHLRLTAQLDALEALHPWLLKLR